MTDTASLTVHAQRAVHALGLHLEARLSSLGLSQAEIHVLALLASGEPLTIGQLHEGLGHRRSTLTGILDRLEAAALVQRRANPADRRSSVVVLTARGRAAAQRVVAALKEIDGLIAGAVTAQERRGFVAVADALATALEPGAGG